MAAISIHDCRPDGVLAFELIDILRAAGPRVPLELWLCARVEALGPRSAELHEASDRARTLPGDELFRIAAGITQVIDGEFRTLSAAPGTWLRIRAIDSTLFVVITDDAEVLARMRAAFHDVRPSPDDDV